VASDYQGETIQVFVFFRGKFLGYQCFGQDRLTVGGAPGMDLPLPDCPEEEGFWDVYVSQGALYAWFRSPAGGNGKEGHEDPRKVQPLDSLSIGEYRLQAKLLEGQGFEQPSAETEEDLTEEEEGEEEQEASSFEDPGEEDGLEPKVAWEAVDEVQGISLDYARSIWKGETEDGRAEPAEVEAEGVELSEEPEVLAEAEDLPPADETQALAGEDQEEESQEDESQKEESDEETSLEAGEEAKAEFPLGMDPRDEKSFLGLSGQSDTVQEGDEGSESEVDEPDALDDEVPGMEEIDEWIGFGLEEDVPVSQDASLPELTCEPEGLQEMVPLETGTDEQKTEKSPWAVDSDGLVEGMSQEERTRFWDEMAQEALAKENESEEEQGESEEAPREASPPDECPLEAKEDLPSAQEEVPLERKPTKAGEPPFASERLECSNTAVAIDDAEAVEEEASAFEDEDEDEEEDEYGQDITYFSLVKEVFPSRAQPSKGPRGDHRALEVVRFRGSDVQDIGYLERGDAYTIRKGWSRSLWKRQGGVPPNFKLARLKNGGLAELHIRDTVKGRLYSEEGSRDIWDLRGGKRGRFGLKGKASWLPLPADTWAVLRVNSGRYMVRYVSSRPKPVAPPLRPNVSMGQFKLVSMSLLSHLLLILMIGLVVPDTTLEGYNRTDRFARIDPDALKALKPPPPTKKLEKPKPVAKKKAPKPKPTPKVASKHPVPKSAKRSPVPTKGKASGGGKKQVDVAQTGLLAALGSPDAGVLNAKGNSEILLAAVTNLDAVAVPSDTTTFNLAGVAGKLATSEIQVPTSEEIETVGAAQLIKNGDGTLGAMASRGSGEVRAVVHEPPKAKISIRGGMSREAVLKVVNAHLDEIRDCYERELLHNPGISGKILMEWLIQLDGAVRYAKVKFTNIGHSSDLHTCLQAQVVTWNFPRPKGGEEVLVTFPFLFESMGF